MPISIVMLAIVGKSSLAGYLASAWDDLMRNQHKNCGVLRQMVQIQAEIEMISRRNLKSDLMITVGE